LGDARGEELFGPELALADAAGTAALRDLPLLGRGPVRHGRVHRVGFPASLTCPVPNTPSISAKKRSEGETKCSLAVLTSTFLPPGTSTSKKTGQGPGWDFMTSWTCWIRSSSRPVLETASRTLPASISRAFSMGVTSETRSEGLS